MISPRFQQVFKLIFNGDKTDEQPAYLFTPAHHKSTMENKKSHVVTSRRRDNAWRPITNVYSPPPNEFLYVLPLLPHESGSPAFVSKIIGHRGSNFKDLTRKCHVSYIWYNDATKSIEVWGKKPANVYTAVGIIFKMVLSAHNGTQ